MAPLIIGPNLARALLEQHGFDVTGHPDFIVHDPGKVDALDIEVRPETIDRMAEQCQRALDGVRSGDTRHDLPPAIAAEVGKLTPWQRRLFWLVIMSRGPLVVQRGRRNGVATVQRALRDYAEAVNDA